MTNKLQTDDLLLCFSNKLKVGRSVSLKYFCLLDTGGKILEWLVAKRLEKHFRGRHALSANQYGFRAGRSTIDAANKLKRLASSAIKKHQFGAAVSLDIKNAFNTMPWPRILEALENAKVPAYLRRIIRDYFRDRIVLANTASSVVKREMTCGVPQGSVLGPLLWNIAFDGILRTQVPPGVNIVCYADDTLVVATEPDIPTLERKVNAALEAMTRWIESAGLDLAAQKTEAVLFTCCRRFDPPSFRLKGVAIELCTALKYLGLWFDGKLTFKEHARRTAAKTERIVASISRLMSNLGGPTEKKRRLLVNVAMSVLLYGAPIWADAINARAYRRAEMVSVQRKAALRCVSAYRTVSTEAVCVLAAIPPIELAADERKRVHRATRGLQPGSRQALRARRDERQVTLRIWEERLSQSSKGEWTRLLVRDLKAWLERRHGQMDFYLTQVMSGHGAFNKYLFRMRLADSPECANCDTRGRDDDAWHTLFECPAYIQQREEAMTALQEMGEQPLSPETLVPTLLRSEAAWDLVAAFVASVMRSKMKSARERQRGVAVNQHPMPDLAIPPVPVAYHPNSEEEEAIDDPGLYLSSSP